jgi:hypothetical protein
MTHWSDPYKSMITDTKIRTLIVKRGKMIRRGAELCVSVCYVLEGPCRFTVTAEGRTRHPALTRTI